MAASADLSTKSDLVACVVLIVLVVTMLLAYLRHVMERQISQKPEVFSVVEHVYGELSVAGLLSLLMFLLETSVGLVQIVADHIGEPYLVLKSVVETSHMLLLVGALLYMSVAGFVVFILQKTANTWTQMDEHPMTDCVAEYLEVLKESKPGANTSYHRVFLFTLWSWCSGLKFQLKAARSRLVFKFLRCEFVEQFAVDADLMQKFDFLFYMRMALFGKFISRHVKPVMSDIKNIFMNRSVDFPIMTDRSVFGPCRIALDKWCSCVYSGVCPMAPRALV